MLEQLSLINFEAHEQDTYQFSPTVTSLVGPTDSGKSSIVRCLRWVCLNTPVGTPFLRWGADFVRAVLKFDGHTLVRRAGDKNIYKLDKAKSAAFGRSVPPDIEKLLNVSELNFQQQIEGPFWLSQSAPQVSRALNAVIDLGVIDDVMAYIASKAREAKAAVTLTEERREAAKKEKEALAHVPRLGKLFAQVEVAEAEQERIKGREALLYTLVQQVKALDRQAGKAKQLADMAIAAQEAASKASEAQRRRKALFDVVSWLRNAQEQAKRPPLDDTPYQEAYGKWKVSWERLRNLGMLRKDLRAATLCLDVIRKRADDLQKEAANALGEVCPLCGSPTAK